MSTEEAELPGEEDERGWRERFAQVSAAGRPLFATRLEILREELAGKRVGIILSGGNIDSETLRRVVSREL